MALTFSDFLLLTKSRKEFLFNLTGWDGTNSTTFRLSNLPKVYNGYFYEPRVKGIPSFSRVMQLWRFVSSQTSFGNLVILNGDGAMDSMRNWVFDGQPFSCVLGGASETEDLPDSEYTEVLHGIMGKPEYSDDRIVIPVYDISYKLASEQLPPNTYTGSETWDSIYPGYGSTPDMPAEVVNTPKPLCYGKVKNARPVLVHTSDMIFQVNDGQIKGVTAVYDDGSSFSSYVQDAASGTFRLTASPVGGLSNITCDIEGISTDGGTTYLQKPGEITQHAATTYGGLSTGDLDTASFSQLDADRPYLMGYYLRQKKTLFAFFDDLLGGILADWGFTRAGKLQVLAFELPGTATQTYEDVEFITFRELKNILPSVFYRFTVRYKRDWSDDDATLTVVVEDSTVRNKFATAREREIDTYLVNQADATAVGNKFLSIYDGTHYAIEFTIKIRAFVHELMDTIAVNRSRYGMTGRSFRIVGVNEDYTNNRVKLTAFGG